MLLTKESVLDRTAPEPDSDQGVRPRRRGTLGAVFGALLVVCVVIAVAGGLFSDGDEPPPPPQPGATTGRPLDMAVGRQEIPTTAPSDVRWDMFEGIALPVSASAGPHHIDGPVHNGYARTPEGALVATVQLSYRYLVTPGRGWRRVVTEQVLPGPGRDAYVKARAAVEDQQLSTEGMLQVAGFRFVTFTPDVAVIQVATARSEGGYQFTTSTVRWIDGDWKLELQRDGSDSVGAQTVPTLDGFVPWSGM